LQLDQDKHGVFPAKMCSDHRKNHACGQKKKKQQQQQQKQNALALLYLASGLLPSAANSSDVPTEFAVLNTTKMTSRRQISLLEIFVFTRKTTEYSVELFLFSYSYWIFFLKFKTSTLLNNRFS